MTAVSKFIERTFWSPYRPRSSFSSMLQMEIWHADQKRRIAQNHLLAGAFLGLFMGICFMTAVIYWKGQP